MKKTNRSALLIALVLVLSLLLSACGGSADANKGGAGGNAGTDAATEDAAKAPEEGKDDKDDKNDDASASQAIVNDEGEEFLTLAKEGGKVVKDAAPLGSNTVVLDGKSYEFPLRVSALLEDGWAFSSGFEFENEFDANATTNLISFYLVKDGNEIELDSVYNDSDEVSEIEDCLLTGFRIDYFDIDEGSEFVFPGGITIESTSLDVLNIFGNPNNNSNFERGYNLDHQLTYENHKESNLRRYSFTFRDESDDVEYLGYISSISIEWEK